jgi:transposase
MLPAVKQRATPRWPKASLPRPFSRRGKQQALVVVGHSLLVTGFYLITRHTKYEDLGDNYFDECDRKVVRRQAVKRLEELGHRVDLRLAPVTAA